VTRSTFACEERRLLGHDAFRIDLCMKTLDGEIKVHVEHLVFSAG